MEASKTDMDDRANPRHPSLAQRLMHAGGRLRIAAYGLAVDPENRVVAGENDLELGKISVGQRQIRWLRDVIRGLEVEIWAG